MHTLDDGEVEWDRDKAALNASKHGVRFAEAAYALADPMAVSRIDPDCNGEIRYISLGVNIKGRVLLTVFTHRGERLRIISARRATASERRQYLKR